MSANLQRFYYDIDNKRYINLIGTKVSERGYLLRNKSVLYVALDNVTALNMSKQLNSLGNKCGILTAPLDDVVYANMNAFEIMDTMSRVVSGEYKSLVVTYNFLMQKLPPRDLIKESIYTITSGEQINLSVLVKRLTLLGFERKSLLENCGDFTVKGDVVDIYLMDKAVRVDVGFDVVGSISIIDPATLKSITQIDAFTVYPLTMFLKEPDTYNNLPLVKYINSNVTDFFDIIVLDEPNLIVNRLGELYEASVQNINSQIKNNLATKEHLNWYERDWFHFSGKTVIGVCGIGGNNLFKPDDVISIDTISINNYTYNQKLLIEDLKYYISLDYDIKLFLGNETRCEQFKKYISSELKCDKIEFYSEYLHLSVGLPQEKLLLIGTNNLVKQKVVTQKKNDRVFYLPKVGDYVVHEMHGIGLCKEIKTMNLGLGEKDYFVIEYSKEAILYLPSEQVNEISQYLGGDNPKLNELGSAQFAKAKQRAKDSLKKLAIDLKKIYYKRSQTKGFVYPEDDELVVAFENGFGYELTIDQQTAVNEIKSDMQKGKVMDRLLCGDVGYGKTEVALICAYKHILSGKQVAFLAPTTILSMQHYNTAQSRMKPFMVNVALLNRFTPTAEVKRIKQGLKDKTIDIVIGTHKLLSKDVEFKDLGLLILDEEQRFGVNDKEKLKQLPTLNVLTLSATPIPRTLNMSLSGIRDISIIATPPVGRLPITTIVTEENDMILKDAITRELNRDGQVLIINDKVENLSSVAKRIIDLSGESVDIAHGQMDKKDIEKAMLRMYNQQSKILLATSLIENGIDLPKANTLIVINSDRFGLSQLYQMRGRVGRSREQAYAYFTYKNLFELSSTAVKRLEALKEFNDLGSGFKIAMRDLELRGAGTILGAEQSGYMEKIGYELYQRLLTEVLNEMDGKTESVNREVKISVNEPAVLSAMYIPNETERIKIYNEIAGINNEQQRQDELKSIAGRFGKIPKEVDTLTMVAMLKNMASKIGIKSIIIGDCANITFYEDGSLMDAIEFLKGQKVEISKQNRSLKIFAGVKNEQIIKIIAIFLNKMLNKCCEIEPN